MRFGSRAREKNGMVGPSHEHEPNETELIISFDKKYE